MQIMQIMQIIMQIIMHLIIRLAAFCLKLNFGPNAADFRDVG